jgi:hypothetical protein
MQGTTHASVDFNIYKHNPRVTSVPWNVDNCHRTEQNNRSRDRQSRNRNLFTNRLSDIIPRNQNICREWTFLGPVLNRGLRCPWRLTARVSELLGYFWNRSTYSVIGVLQLSRGRYWWCLVHCLVRSPTKWSDQLKDIGICFAYNSGSKSENWGSVYCWVRRDIRAILIGHNATLELVRFFKLLDHGNISAHALCRGAKIRDSGQRSIFSIASSCYRCWNVFCICLTLQDIRLQCLQRLTLPYIWGRLSLFRGLYKNPLLIAGTFRGVNSLLGGIPFWPSGIKNSRQRY